MLKVPPCLAHPALAVVALLMLVACESGPDTAGPPGTSWDCVLADQEVPEWGDQVGCLEDFNKLASGRSSKTVIDRFDDDRLYFTNSQLYPIHWEFASTHLGAANGHAPVPDLGGFNLTEYFSPDRRFILGAVTYYEEPDVWAYEIAPYDTASADMVALAYAAIQQNAFFGEELFFHPSSENQEALIPQLPGSVNVITTEELFAGISYQPLNLGYATGQLTFRTAEEVDGQPIYFREVVILDAVPNDIGITAAIVTDAFQTPLSHINVLSQNRGSPNMALIGAFDDPELRALEGQWVEIEVGPLEYRVEAIGAEAAEAWWQDNKPEPLEAVDMDLTWTDLTDAENLLELTNQELPDAIAETIPRFGGKTTHFGGLALIGEDCPVPDAFGVPVFYYDQFMTENGFWDRVDTWLNEANPAFDPLFQDDPAYRQEKLHELQADMLAAPINLEFLATLTTKLTTEYPGVRMRFRSSTTAEDLGAFTGAGLYGSHSGTVGDELEPMEDAVRGTWSTVWNPRAYDEREYYSIDHQKVGMGLLVHRSFPEEEVNGVAITGNIFDQTGYEQAFYINSQIDNWSVVLPEIGVTSDQVLYYFDQPGSPIVYIGHSSLIPDGYTVMDPDQYFELGTALRAIHTYFFPSYGDRGIFYAMDTEFKFEDDGGSERKLYMKQARPFPIWADN